MDRDAEKADNWQGGAARSATATTLKFAFTPLQLRTLHNDKNIQAFVEFGGLRGLAEGLCTDVHNGLNAKHGEHPHASAGDAGHHNPSKEAALGSVAVASTVAKALPLGPSAAKGEDRGEAEDGFEERRRVFLDNQLPTRKTPSFPRLVWMTYNDPTLFLLTAAAVVSLAIGLYQDFAPGTAGDGSRIGWVEGVAILVAIVVIVLVGSVNDWEKQRQFKKLNRKQLERQVKVVRFGHSQLIPISKVLVGDVVRLEPGDVVPADGVLIEGHNITCDESTATGESGLVYKTPADNVYRALGPPPGGSGSGDLANSRLDPFLLSGTQVLEGIGTYLVTMTGRNSTYGQILASLGDDTEPTPLQRRLEVVAKYIARVGAIFAGLLFLALFIKFAAGLPHSALSPAEKGQIFVDIVIISLTVLVIAVPEGLPLAVTLALAFATIQMLKESNLVRRLQACETMGNATSICSDKTGTLTENKMVVVAGALGLKCQFDDDANIEDVEEVEDEDNHEKSNDTGTSMSTSTAEAVPPPSPEKAAASAGAQSARKSSADFVARLAPEVKTLLVQSIAVNTTAFEARDGQSFVGSTTESALLTFGRLRLGMGPVAAERSTGTIVQVFPFQAERQCMVTVVALPGSTSQHRVFVKGAPEVLLDRSSRILCDPAVGTLDTAMTPQTRQHLLNTMDKYGDRAMRTIGLAYRDVPAVPAKTQLDDFLADLVFLGVIGIVDPLRPGVPRAVQLCQRAGVTVRMVTGDSTATATAVARQCGILSAGSDNVVLEGSEFRKLSQEALDGVIPRLRVLARSAPDDKRRLVVRLRELGEIVAATGDGTNDAPALSAADISFSMGGISGTDIAREASSIVLLTDDFSCIVQALMWGRAVNHAIKKFLQFQITITVTSVGLTFVSSIADPTEHSVLTAVQLMWVNLVQDTLAALALATDAPQTSILDRAPESRDAPLVTTEMWKTIAGQSAYQLAVTLVLHFAGTRILTTATPAELQTLVFAAYVWMQIFNLLNCRQFDDSLNVFEGVLRNWLFLAIAVGMAGIQILILFVGGQAFSVVPLTGAQWAISIVLGLLSIPIGVLIRIVPVAPIDGARGWLSRAWNGTKSRISISRNERRQPEQAAANIEP